MGGSHDHAEQYSGDHRNRLIIAFALTAGVVVAQFVGSIVTGSIALLTDTAHALTDAIGLLVALIAASLIRRPATSKRTWSFHRVEVIAAFGQATLLIAVGVYTAIESVRRLIAPPEVASNEMLVFGIIGLTVNIIAILVLSSGRKANFNMRAAFLEVLNDALGSIGVIAAAIIISTTGYLRADALAGLFIAGLIVPRAVVILCDTVRVLMEFTPAGLDLDEVRRHILELDHVLAVHDLHASTIATGLPTLTAHVVVDDECFRSGHAPEVLVEVRNCVAEDFDISVTHSTFQLETTAVSEGEERATRHV